MLFKLLRHCDIHEVHVRRINSDYSKRVSFIFDTRAEIGNEQTHHDTTFSRIRDGVERHDIAAHLEGAKHGRAAKRRRRDSFRRCDNGENSGEPAFKIQRFEDGMGQCRARKANVGKSPRKIAERRDEISGRRRCDVGVCNGNKEREKGSEKGREKHGKRQMFSLGSVRARRRRKMISRRKMTRGTTNRMSVHS